MSKKVFTKGTEIATKEYVDAVDQSLLGQIQANATQYSVMPTASADNLGRIIQYTGATTQDFTKGYFYQVVSDEAQEPTYSWKNIQLQPSEELWIDFTDNDTRAETIPYVGKKLLEYVKRTGKANINVYAYYYWKNSIREYEKRLYRTDSIWVQSSRLFLHFTPVSYEGTDSIGTYAGTIRTTKGFYVNINHTNFEYTGYNVSETNITFALDQQNLLNVNNTKAFTPTGDYNPANKKYVDDTVANATIQVTTMPTASADNLGKIVQYVGTTDSTYTNGYFYKCVSDGEATPTYNWENIQVQDGGSEYYPVYTFKTTQDYNAPWNYRGDDLLKLQEIVQDAYNNSSKVILVLFSKKDIYSNALLRNNKDMSVQSTNYSFTGYSYLGNTSGEACYAVQISINGTWSNDIFTITSARYSQKDITSLPKANTDYFVPTGDYNPSTKKYSDMTSVLNANNISAYSNASYAVGDIVYYFQSNKFYKCIQDAQYKEPPYYPDYWEEITLTNKQLTLANQKYVDDLVGDINTILATLVTVDEEEY